MLALISRMARFVSRRWADVRLAREERLNEEIQHHLAHLAAEYERCGMTPEDARFAARRAFGRVQAMKERHRDLRGLGWIDDLVRDVRHALRVLRRDPGFTLVATASLALAIGAATAVFGIVDAVFVKELPVRDPDELVVLAARQPGRPGPPGRAFSYDQYQMLRRSGVLSDVVASAPLRMSLDAAGYEEPSIAGQLVSANYYAMFAVAPAVGRLITPADEAAASEIAVLSHAYFIRRFGGEPSIVGQTIRVNGRPVTVVGVSAAGFFGTRPGSPVDVTVPVWMQEQVMTQVDSSWIRDPYQFWLELYGRLDRRGPLPQARARLDAVFQAHRDVLRTRGRVGPPVVLELEPGAQGTDDVRARYAVAVAVLVGIAALLLVAACAGVANLLLARAFKRRGEVALRLSLGAGRGRVVRQLMSEAIVVAALGSVAGLLVAGAGTGLLRSLLGADPLQHAVARPDGRALLFTAAVSLLTAVLMSAAPLALVAGLEPFRTLKDRDRGAVGRRHLGQSVLVSVQVAVSLILLVGAGLFLRTLLNLRTLELGFDQEQVLVTRLEPEGSNQKRWPDGRFKGALLRTYAEVIERVESLPGVRSASLAGVTPLGVGENPLTARVRGPGAEARDDDPEIRVVQVYPSYFSTMSIPMLAGRDLSPAENDPALADAPVGSIVINRTMAAQMFSGEAGAVGQRLAIGAAGRLVEIVGVVDDVRDRGPREAVEPTAYATYVQAPTGRAQMTLYVRVSGAPLPVASGVRDVLEAVDPTMQRLAVQQVAERVADSMSRERVVALLATTFGLVALLLASISLYGVAAYAAARRTREFGLRMALGAHRGSLAALVAAHTLRLVAVGSTAGVVVAIAGSRFVASHLFGVAATDVVTMAGAVCLLALVSALATLVPVRRAMRLDPVAALRVE